MGVENIIKRLQDIDKLKFVLFDKDQRKFFEQLPKPGITKKFSPNDSFFTIETVIRSKKELDFNENPAFQKFKLTFDNNLINKRLSEMMESRKPLTNQGFFFLGI